MRIAKFFGNGLVILQILTLNAYGQNCVDCSQQLNTKTVISNLLPNPCSETTLSSRDFEEEYFPSFKKSVIRTDRKITVWRYGFRTPQYPNGVPEGKYDSSTPMISKEFLKHPSGNASDYEGPVDPKKGAKQAFNKVVKSAIFGNLDGGVWGNGMYTAADPLSSLSYYHGSLIRVEIPKNSKLLALPDHYLPVSPEIEKKITCARRARTAGPPLGWDQKEIGNAIADIEYSQEHVKLIDYRQLEFIPEARIALQKFFEANDVVGLEEDWENPAYLSCAIKHGSPQRPNFLGQGRMIVIKNQTSEKNVRVKLMVDSLEAKVGRSKEKLYREALDTFEVFDFSECKKFPLGTESSLCDERTYQGKKSRENFWILYRAWATHFYRLDPNISQQELEKVHLERFREMDAEKRSRIVAQTLGCGDGDF